MLLQLILNSRLLALSLHDDVSIISSIKILTSSQLTLHFSYYPNAYIFLHIFSRKRYVLLSDSGLSLQASRTGVTRTVTTTLRSALEEYVGVSRPIHSLYKL